MRLILFLENTVPDALNTLMVHLLVEQTALASLRRPTEETAVHLSSTVPVGRHHVWPLVNRKKLLDFTADIVRNSNWRLLFFTKRIRVEVCVVSKASAATGSGSKLTTFVISVWNLFLTSPATSVLRNRRCFDLGSTVLANVLMHSYPRYSESSVQNRTFKFRSNVFPNS